MTSPRFASMGRMPTYAWMLMEKGRNRKTGAPGWKPQGELLTSRVELEMFLHNFRGVGQFALARIDADDQPGTSSHEINADHVVEFSANHGTLDQPIAQILDELLGLGQ